MTKAPKNWRQTGYLIPDEISPTDNICICVPIPKDWGHVRAFLGQLTELSKWQAWQTDGTTNARDTARRWFDITQCVAEEIECAMANKGCGCGDTPDRLYRHNPDTDRIEQSDDGGATWQNSPDPRYNSPLFPPVTGIDEADVRCISATNAMAYYRDELVAQASEWTTLTTVIAGFITVLVGLLTGGVGAALVITLCAAWIDSGIGAAVLAHTPEVFDRFKCNLFCHALPDGSWDEAALVAIKARIDVDETATANLLLKGWIDQLGTVGLTNSGRLNLGETADCSTCSACEDCSNLDSWGIVYGTTITKTPGYWKLSSSAVGPNQGVRLARTVAPPSNCCSVVYNVTAGVVQNQAWYRCADDVVVFSPPVSGDCMYDVHLTNIFNVPFEVEFFFSECP